MQRHSPFVRFRQAIHRQFSLQATSICVRLGSIFSIHTWKHLHCWPASLRIPPYILLGILVVALLRYVRKIIYLLRDMWRLGLASSHLLLRARPTTSRAHVDSGICPMRILLFRSYYTFPTKLEVQSVLVRPNHAACSWNHWCTPTYQLPALQPLQAFPGENGCLPSVIAPAQCTNFHKPACLFHRWYLTPKVDHTFEVRELTATQCRPRFLVAVTQGSQQWHSSVTSGYDDHGLSIDLVGSMNRDTTFFPSHLLIFQPLRNWPRQTPPTFLVNAAPQGQPIATRVGDIQARSPSDKNFTFAPHMATCTPAKDRVDCIRSTSPLHSNPFFPDAHHGDAALPHVRGHHDLSFTPEGTLVSTLLQSPAVKPSSPCKSTTCLSPSPVSVLPSRRNTPWKDVMPVMVCLLDFSCKPVQCALLALHV